MKTYLLRFASGLIWLALCFISVESQAATHLSTLYKKEVGSERALQGIAAGPSYFYTSEGGSANPEYLYRFDRDWNLLQYADADPGLERISHCGDITTDRDRVYAPLSNFGGIGSPRFGIAAYDRPSMSFQGFWDL